MMIVFKGIVQLSPLLHHIWLLTPIVHLSPLVIILIEDMVNLIDLLVMIMVETPFLQEDVDSINKYLLPQVPHRIQMETIYPFFRFVEMLGILVAGIGLIITISLSRFQQPLHL